MVSTSIADIFRNNSLKNGLCPSWSTPRRTPSCWPRLARRSRCRSSDRSLTLPDGSTTKFPMDPFARFCLLNGVDELQFLLSQEEAIAAFESRRS